MRGEGAQSIPHSDTNTMQHLLLRLVLVGSLLAVAVAGGFGSPKRSCRTEELALHINILPYPITAAVRGGASCEVVRSGVDSSLAATGDTIPCLCFLDNFSDFLFTALFIVDVPDEIYAPCGGQRVKEARLLAARCEGIAHMWSPSPAKDKGHGVEATQGLIRPSTNSANQ